MSERIHSIRGLVGPFAAIALSLALFGCNAVNTLVVENASSNQLRVILKVPGGGVSSVSPTPGNSSHVVVSENGTFQALAVVDGEWLETVRFRRDFLSRQLAEPAARRRLTSEELRQIGAQVNDLSTEIQRATEQRLENLGACSGTVRLTGSGGVAGTVRITDNPTGSFPAFVLLCQ
jgi:hypothetical protein